MGKCNKRERWAKRLGQDFGVMCQKTGLQLVDPERATDVAADFVATCSDAELELAGWGLTRKWDEYANKVIHNAKIVD